MEVKKLAIDQEGPFDHLPDDLLVSILSRLTDLRYLCQCSLVSKRFASIIPKTRTISVVIPSNGDYKTYESLPSILKFLCALRDPLVDVSPGFMDSYVKKLKLPMFLDKFTKLETLYVKYRSPNPSNSDSSSFSKWKVKCSSNTMIESMVTILPEYSAESVWLSFGRCIELLSVVCMLVRTHTSLKMVSISDVCERGKLILRDEELVQLRSYVPGLEEFENYKHPKIMFGLIPRLHLPLSGRTMSNVCIIITNYPVKSGAQTRWPKDQYDEIMSWNFDDDEKIIGEVLKEVLKKHRQKLIQMEVFSL